MSKDLEKVFVITDPDGETNKYLFVPLSEYCEIYWQAAIMYAQKYRRAKSEGDEAKAMYNKTMALSSAMCVWCKMGFSVEELKIHQDIFRGTILKKGGDHSSVTDYFTEIKEAGVYYPANKEGQPIADA